MKVRVWNKEKVANGIIDTISSATFHPSFNSNERFRGLVMNLIISYYPTLNQKAEATLLGTYHQKANNAY
jgi:hypothetical protein